VLVVFKLDEEGNQDTASGRRNRKARGSTVVEDIGEVRHTETTPNGLSIAVELTGLSDSDVNELIRATNQASLKASAGNSNAADPVEAEANTAMPAPA
jgi:hypothetical protein